MPFKRLEKPAASKPTKKGAFIPSDQQAAIFNAMRDSSDHIMVNALAGVGKSTSMIEGSKGLKGRSGFAAFNKAIAKEQELAKAASEVQVVLAAPLPTKAKATGSTLRQMLRFEVLDIRAVYQARPELCTIEIKKSAVQATCVPEIPVPGLKLWYENVTSIRG